MIFITRRKKIIQRSDFIALLSPEKNKWKKDRKWLYKVIVIKGFNFFQNEKRCENIVQTKGVLF